MTFAQWLWELAKRAGGKRRRRTAFAPAMLLTLALATGCSARTPEGYELTIGGAPDSSRAVSVAPPGPAAAPHAVQDPTARMLLGRIATALGALDWREARQACADLQEWAKSRERAGAPAAALAAAPDKDTPAVAGVRERADEAFWQELER